MCNLILVLNGRDVDSRGQIVYRIDAGKSHFVHNLGHNGRGFDLIDIQFGTGGGKAFFGLLIIEMDHLGCDVGVGR